MTDTTDLVAELRRELAREHQLLLNAQDAIREVSAEAATAEREVERLREAGRWHLGHNVGCESLTFSQCARKHELRHGGCKQCLPENYTFCKALEGQQEANADDEERYVTREMALDAGDPEGQPVGGGR